MSTEDQLRANPRPWMTDGSIEFIEKHIRPTDHVIEYGGGWSSLWWAARAAWTLTVEADYNWAAKLLVEMARHPELMTKWSLRFVASEWSVNFQNPKKYWTDNAKHINDESARRLEDAYLAVDFSPDVFVIDGSARVRNADIVDEYSAAHESVRMIVIDNMEVMERYTLGKFKTFERHDFPEFDVAKIPIHQNGKWVTSVFVR